MNPAPDDSRAAPSRSSDSEGQDPPNTPAPAGASHHQLVARLFEGALDRPEGEGEAWLERQLEAHPHAAAEALDLFRLHDEGRGALDPSAYADITWPPQRDPRADPRTWLVPGLVIGSRYELGERLGAGTFGVVHAARDAFTSADVAIKVHLRPLESFHWSRPRELDALLFVDLPGVIQLLDEGEVGGHCYLVLPRVHGSAFPGVPAPCSWDSIARTTIDVLRTLDRLHALGICHGDLKPANVMVDSGGWPTILDLGVCSGPEFCLPERRDGLVGGTRKYFSPELLEGGARGATPQSDLYAVGLLIAYALTGSVPHADRGMDELPRRRATESVDVRAMVGPDAPDEVVDVIAQLLARDPAGRPPSAGEAAARLAGELPDQDALRGIPLPGREDLLAGLTEKVRAGQSVDLAGTIGSGRERLLGALEDRLARDGVRVHAVRGRPADPPGHGLLTAHAAANEALEDRTAPDAELLEAWVAAELARGSVFLTADIDALDAWSAACLLRHRDDGALVLGRVSETPGCVLLGPIERRQLRDLFGGHSRLLHLPEDAADLLYERTGGVAACIVAELSTWVRSGLARVQGGRVHVGRAALDRLAGMPVVLPPYVRGGHARLPSGGLELDLLWWCQLAGNLATAAVLRRLSRADDAAVEDALLRLIARGLLSRMPSGAFSPTIPLPPRDPSDPQGLAAAHAQIAEECEPGGEERVRHLMAAGETDALLDEVCLRAQVLRGEGRVGAARGMIHAVLARLRGGSETVDQQRRHAAHRELVCCVIGDAQLRALELALYELRRCEPRDAPTAWLIGLMRAALASMKGDLGKSLELSARIGPSDDPGLELHRRSVMHFAGVRVRDADMQRSVHEDCVGWMELQDSDESRRTIASWRARYAYQTDRYADAATYAEEAARHARMPGTRLTTLLDAASFAMEVGRLDVAATTAEEARSQATLTRQPFALGRAEWLLRRAAYSSGRAVDVDEELVSAVAELPVQYLRGAIALTEAAIAWMARRDTRARELAGIACAGWRETGAMPGLWLSTALAYACAGPAPREELERLVEIAPDASPPGIGLQVMGLCALRLGRLEERHERVAERLHAALHADVRGVRREVLSPDEALAYVRGEQPAD